MIGFLKNGTNTSDANATEEDMIYPKTAYVKGEKISGKMVLTGKELLEPVLVKKSYSTNLNSNYMAATPDNKCVISTNTQGNVILTNLETGTYTSYTQSELGITNGGTANNAVKAISVCKTPNSDGAYLVVFMTRNNWSDGITIYTSCCYYKNGELGYIKDSDQAKYYNSLTRRSDWGQGSIVASNTKPNTFIIVAAAGYYGRGGRNTGLSLVVTVAEDLKSHTSVNLGMKDGEYSYQHSILKLSDDDRFLALCHKDSSNALSLLNDNLQQVTFGAVTTSNRTEFFSKNNNIYVLENNTLYKLIYTTGSSTYTKTQIGNANILETTYREITHNDNLIVTLDSDNKYRFYSYEIDDSLGMTVSLLKTLDAPSAFVTTNVNTVNNSNNVFCKGANNTIIRYNLLQEGEIIPETITRDDFILFNTIESNASSGDILLNKKAYNEDGEVNGTMPNNGALSYTPSDSQQSIPSGYTSGGTIAAVSKQNKSVTPSTSQQIITPDSGYNGLGQVTVGAVDNTIDQNIVAGNIKKNVQILGVTGTLEESSGTDTSDATATAEDMIYPKTAYARGEKIIGNMELTTKINSEDVVLLNKDDYILELNPNYMTTTPDGYLISTNTNGNVILTNIETGESKSYTQSELGIVNGVTTADGVKGISVGGCPNEYGAYLVGFHTLSGWAGNVNVTFCYYKDGELGYQHDENQNKYYQISIGSDWGRGTLCISHTKPDYAIVLSVKGSRYGDYSRSMQVALDLKSVTSHNLAYTAGEYGHRLIRMSANDKFVVFLHKGDSSNENILARLNADYTIANKTYGSSTLYSWEFFEKNGDTYILQDRYMYKLIYNDSGTNYTLTQVGTQPVLPTTYREIVHTDKLIMTLDTDQKYRIYYYDIQSDEVIVELLEEINSPIAYNGSKITMTVYNDTIFYMALLNKVSSVSVLASSAEIPTMIHKGYYYLYNTMEADAISSNILLNKKAYGTNGKIVGTMANNGSLSYTPSTSQQTIPEGYTSGGTIAAVTSAIDANILPENIKDGVEILGVIGTYTGS